MKCLHSMAVVLALCFVWAGSGVNYVHYCCAECRDAGISRVLEESCEAVHHHGHGCQACGQSDCCHHSGTCAFVRLHISEGGISHSIHVPSAQVVVEEFLFADEEELLQTLSERSVKFYSLYSHVPAPLSGRGVSIQHCSWLI